MLSAIIEELDEIQTCLVATNELIVPSDDLPIDRNGLATLLGYFLKRQNELLDKLKNDANRD